MLRENGNLLTDNIPITVEFLDHCKRNGIKICLKTGDFGKDLVLTKARKPFIKEIASEIFNLYYHGEMMPTHFFDVFGFNSPHRITHVFKKCGLTPLPRKTYYEFYGDSVHKTRKQTMKSMYGVENALESPVLRQKAVETWVSIYGAPHPMKSRNVRDKLANTNIERYGVPCIFSSESHLDLIKENALAARATKNPRLASILEKRANIDNLGPADIDDILSMGFNVPHRNRILYSLGLKEPTEYSTELKIKAFLEILGVNFIQNAKKAHGVRFNKMYYDADFLIPDLKLVIEVNGLAFHSVNRSANGNRKTKDYHFNKFKAFYDAGYRMISFTDYELDHMWSSVTEIIKFHLGLVTELSESTKVEYQEFLGYPIEESLNYGFFNKESIDFEKEVEINPKMIGKWEYYDCGRLKNAK